ncbi:protein kinase [Rhodopirellula sallentina]|nr:protein kinase [Rhodopirellula sallentina]
MDQLTRRRLIVNCILFSGLAAIVLVFLNLPCEHVQVLSVREGRLSDSGLTGMLGAIDEVERAGWPLNYRVRIQARTSDDEPTLLYESMGNLVGNIAIGLGVIALTCFYTWRRYHQVSASSNPKKARLRFDATTAGLALFIPVGLYLLSMLTAAQHKRIAMRASEYGHCELNAEIPRWLASRIPKPFFRAFLRIKDVEVRQPTTEMLSELLNLSTVRGVRVISTKLEGEDFANLHRARELTEIVLEGCSMSREAITLLSDHDQLRDLTLRRCRIEREDLESLNRLSNLESVDFSRSALNFEDFKQNGWAPSVRYLRLPMPRGENRARLELTNWTALEELSLERTRRRSDDVIELRLRACPRLHSLFLPTPQLYALYAKGLPSLENLFESLDLPIGSPHDATNVFLPRWETIDMAEVPKLTRVECSVTDLKHLRLSGVDRLRDVVIGQSMFSPMYLQESVPPHYENAVKWVDEISKLPGVTSLTMDRILLGEDELEKISQMQSLEVLTLTNAGLTTEQLGPLTKLQSLEQLNLHQCEISSEQMRQFLSLPKLSVLTADLSGLDELRLSNHVRIKNVVTLPFQNLKSIELDNLPRYAGSLVVQDGLEDLHISRLPNLMELTVECPWPEEATFERVDGLLRFAAGGRHLDDRVVEMLLKCSELDQLILAYASLSRDALSQLGKLKSLTALEVPGSLVDDEVTSSWRDLKRLRRVCFDDTAISEETVDWLATLTSLRSLSLDRVALSDLAWEKITTFSQLSELSVKGTTIPYRLLNRFVRHGGLEVLDISGFEVTDELAEAILHARYLHTLFILDSQIEMKRVKQMLEKHRHLLMIANFSEEQLESLPEEYRARIVPSVEANNRRRNSRQSHLVIVLAIDKDEQKNETYIVNRPFNVSRFREEVSRSRNEVSRSREESVEAESAEVPVGDP